MKIIAASRNLALTSKCYKRYNPRLQSSFYYIVWLNETDFIYASGNSREIAALLSKLERLGWVRVLLFMFGSAN